MPFLVSTNPVVTISGSDPIVSTGGPTPVISIQNATVDQKGAVQLEDSVISTSTVKAATPKNIKETYEHIIAVSGTLQTDIDTKLENIVEDTNPELGGDLSCNGYNIENVGRVCGNSLLSRVYNNTGSTLTKGTAVTICGLHNEVCTVCVSDNREIEKMPCCGVIESNILNDDEGCGIRIGRINMDTSGMTGSAEDRLYVQSDGSLDTTIPSSGMVQRVGFLVKKAAGSAGRICVCVRGPRSMYSAKDQHPIVRMGNDAGHQKVVFRDYNDNEVSALDDSGNLTISGTVDGVDIDGFKSDFDFHDHDDRYYTESEVDTISGSLNTKINDTDNYQNWKFAVDGITKDDITSEDTLNFVGGDNITIIRSADDEITISGSAGNGINDKIEEGNSSVEIVDTGSDGHVKFITEGTERMRISTAGEITAPYQPAFQVKKTSNQTIPVNTQTTITWQTEIFDQGNDFAANIFTAPVTGKYYLSLLIRLENVDVSATSYSLALDTSNQNYSFMVDPLFTGDPDFVSCCWSVVADLDANDTAYVRFYQIGGTEQTVVEHSVSRFSGALLY